MPLLGLQPFAKSPPYFMTRSSCRLICLFHAQRPLPEHQHGSDDEQRWWPAQNSHDEERLAIFGDIWDVVEQDLETCPFFKYTIPNTKNPPGITNLYLQITSNTKMDIPKFVYDWHCKTSFYTRLIEKAWISGSLPACSVGKQNPGWLKYFEKGQIQRK